MKLMKEYQTKAKWALGIEKGTPLLGYYAGGVPALYGRPHANYSMMDMGMNVLLQGHIRPTGMGRGRSSVTFYFKDENDNSFNFSAKGTLQLFELIASGEVVVNNTTGEFFGWWTCSKQGTEVSIIPVTKEDAHKIMS